MARAKKYIGVSCHYCIVFWSLDIYLGARCAPSRSPARPPRKPALCEVRHLCLMGQQETPQEPGNQGDTAESLQGPAQARPGAGSVASFSTVRMSDTPSRGLQRRLVSKTTLQPPRRELVTRTNAKKKESRSRVDKGLEKLSGSLRSRRCPQGCAFMWQEDLSRELEPEATTAALSLVGADGHPGVAKGRASHWPACLTMRPFKTYSISSFQIYNTVLLTVVTVVYVASPGLTL